MSPAVCQARLCSGDRSDTTLLSGTSESDWGIGLTHRTTSSVRRDHLLTQHQGEGLEASNRLLLCIQVSWGPCRLCTGSKSSCDGAAVISEQSWVMAEVWETGGRKCCHFRERKAGDSTNYRLVNLTSALVDTVVEWIFKDGLRVYREQVKPHPPPPPFW